MFDFDFILNLYKNRGSDSPANAGAATAVTP